MSKAEEFIQENTRNCGNVCSYNSMECAIPWLTPDDARKAVGIAREEVLDAIEKELTRRMLEDYNTGAEEDEIAQGCMASFIMFVRRIKEG